MKLLVYLKAVLQNAVASFGNVQEVVRIDVTAEEKVRDIEKEAYKLGWTEEELFGEKNSLLSILQVRDEIDNVGEEAIRIRHSQGSTVNFYRSAVGQAAVGDKEVRQVRPEGDTETSSSVTGNE
jgi:hypothetical protein